MNAGMWFWAIFVIVGLFGGWWGYNNNPGRAYFGGGFILYVLIGLLGWGVFGAPLK